MKKIIIALAIFPTFLFPLSTVVAQTDVNLGSEVGARIALSVDKKLARGLHISLEEEMRFDNNFAAFDRFHTTLGLSYKVNDHLKLGVGYALINRYNSDSSTFKSARHRLMLDATGSIHLGNWRLSLKERFQATYRTGDMNLYQNQRTALTLKSRLKLQYKGFRRVQPYAYAELRNTLNAPVISATYNNATDKWGYYQDDTFYSKGTAGWFLEGFDGVYVNRMRFAVGAEYRLTRRSSVDVSLMADRSWDKVVDANAEGTKLKSYTRETGFALWLVAAYCYSF